MSPDLVVILHRVDAVPGGRVPDPSVGEHVLRRVDDELLRVDVREKPIEGLTVELLPEVQPVGDVADVDVLQIRSVHVEKTFVPGTVGAKMKR